MNERIKLPAQEWLGYDPERGDIHGYTFEQMREFAQSIIQECLMMVNSTSLGYSDYRAQIEIRMRSDCVDRLREHFEVE